MSGGIFKPKAALYPPGIKAVSPSEGAVVYSEKRAFSRAIHGRAITKPLAVVAAGTPGKAIGVFPIHRLFFRA